MYTQLRLSHVALNPELALGVLPSRQLCLLSSAQAEDDPTITRLIFPVAAADVCDLTRDLYSHGFGHKVVLSGFAVKPQLTYIKLRDPELSEWDDVAELMLRACWLAPWLGSTARGITRLRLHALALTTW